jgi:hypothetical protein
MFLPSMSNSRIVPGGISSFFAVRRNGIASSSPSWLLGDDFQQRSAARGA